jgi:DUF1680 family protein
MPVRLISARPEVTDDRGRLCLERGPLVYCVEAADHDGSLVGLRLSPDMELSAAFRPDLLNGVVVISGMVPGIPDGQAAGRSLIAIPYFAWNHRGNGAMAVWLPLRATTD